MIEIKPLSGVPIEAVTDAFNAAFSDYELPFTATPAYLRERFAASGVRYDLSYGAFDGNRLIGFIINSADDYGGVKAAFNAATGIIPDYRGHGLIYQIANTGMGELAKNGIQKYTLEVLQTNERAIHIYEKLGLRITRNFFCYTGTPKLRTDAKHGVMVVPVADFTNELAGFPRDRLPSWENSDAAILRNAANIEVAYITENGSDESGSEHSNIAAYLAFHRSSGLIHQLWVRPEYRRKGFAAVLVKYVWERFGKVTVNNIDQNDETAAAFWSASGLRLYARQFMMEKMI